jgi:non-heme chloroperoxidase
MTSNRGVRFPDRLPKGVEMKLVAGGFCAIIGIAVLAMAGLLVFGTAEPPPPMKSITSTFATMDFSNLPTIERYRARDGANLSYRTYPAGDRQVAVLIHGSAGNSSDMHTVALALQHANVSVVVPDLRGHGANLPHGDIAYVGQLDDDIADLVEVLRNRYPDAARSLVGFSSGGGFALRIAADLPLGRQFDKYVLLAPYLRYDSPILRSNAPEGTREGGSYDPTAYQGRWVSANVGRIIGLTILGRFGLHTFDGLPVVAFAVPPSEPSVTATYSWRLQQNFGPHYDYIADIRAVSKSMHVFVGSSDELFLPEQMQRIFHSQRPEALVEVLPGLGHSEMVTNQKAIEAVVNACRNGPIG